MVQLAMRELQDDTIKQRATGRGRAKQPAAALFAAIEQMNSERQQQLLMHTMASQLQQQQQSQLQLQLQLQQQSQIINTLLARSGMGMHPPTPLPGGGSTLQSDLPRAAKVCIAA
jgi:hypothetical protein